MEDLTRELLRWISEAWAQMVQAVLEEMWRNWMRRNVRRATPNLEALTYVGQKFTDMVPLDAPQPKAPSNTTSKSQEPSPETDLLSRKGPVPHQSHCRAPNSEWNIATAFKYDVKVFVNDPQGAHREIARKLVLDTGCEKSNWVDHVVLQDLGITPDDIEEVFYETFGQEGICSSQAVRLWFQSPAMRKTYSAWFLVKEGLPYDMVLGADFIIEHKIFASRFGGLESIKRSREQKEKERVDREKRDKEHAEKRRRNEEAKAAAAARRNTTRGR